MKIFTCSCDECQKIFNIGIDLEGNTIYLGEECDCPSSFSKLYEESEK